MRRHRLRRIVLRLAAAALQHQQRRPGEAFGDREMHVDIRRVEHPIDAGRRARRVEQAGRRVDRRAQAEQRPQPEQAGERRRQHRDRQIGEAVALEPRRRVRDRRGRRQAQRPQRVGDAGTAREFVAAVHEHAHARGRQRQRRQQEPRRRAGAARAVRRPVQIGGKAAVQAAHVARRLDQSGDLVGILAAVAQQHQEGADLVRIGRPGQRHGERLARLGAAERARAPRPASQRGHERSEAGVAGRGHADFPPRRAAGRQPACPRPPLPRPCRPHPWLGRLAGGAGNPVVSRQGPATRATRATRAPEPGRRDATPVAAWPPREAVRFEVAARHPRRARAGGVGWERQARIAHTARCNAR
jgi:hypothetical protein